VEYGNPISYLVLEPGTDVICSDGARVGTVEHVLYDQGEDVFDGIVVELDGAMHFADADQVDRIYERGVLLKVPSTEAGQLPKPTPAPAVLENHGVEDSEGHLQGKLHRAWDRISGKY